MKIGGEIDAVIRMKFPALSSVIVWAMMSGRHVPLAEITIGLFGGLASNRHHANDKDHIGFMGIS